MANKLDEGDDGEDKKKACAKDQRGGLRVRLQLELTDVGKARGDFV
jgi:hypothetical protein